MAKAKTTSSPALPKIYTVRRHKVVLDTDLAKLYGVSTSRFNEAVKRNAARFPADFRFRLTTEEEQAVQGQSHPSDAGAENQRSQIAILKKGRGRHRKYPTWAFTEHGALMAANVLRSAKAVEMSIYLVRAFVQMREAILANTHILKRLAEIDRRLIEHDSVLREVVEQLQPLLDEPEEEDEKPKIGYHQGNR